MLKGKDDKLVLKPVDCQIVTVSGRRFQLLVLLKVGRKFRIWMRDTATNEVFAAMARDVEAVTAVPANDREAFDASRMLVHFILLSLMQIMCLSL